MRRTRVSPFALMIGAVVVMLSGMTAANMADAGPSQVTAVTRPHVPHTTRKPAVHTPSTGAPVTTKPPGRGKSRLIAAAGDIACEPGSAIWNHGHGIYGQGDKDACHMRETANLLMQMKLSALLTLGDNQYKIAKLSDFRRSYAKTWGQEPLKRITRPVPGNHDHATLNAAGYFAYFGQVAGNIHKSWYSYDVGEWHLIALDSECAKVGGCQRGSLQERWLREDLRTNPARCTLAYWHVPRWSSGEHGDNPGYDAFMRDLQAAHAELLLVGHDHDYERYAPQTPDGVASPNGIREIIVGTGGKTHYGLKPTPGRNTEVRDQSTFGVLQLRLNPNSYDWKFVPEPGKTFHDSGHTACH